MVTAVQLTAHFVNEYADRDVDQTVERRTAFSGGSGVLVSGALEPTVALRAAWVTSSIAVGLAVAVAAGWSLPAAGLGLAALAVSWGYSMPPLRLLGSGWGELAASLVVVVAVPLTGWAVQQAPADPALWWAVSILLPVHIAMMLGFDLPDIASDEVAGKRVLGVRLGESRSQLLIAALLVLAAAIAVLGAATGGIAAAALLVIPAALIPAGGFLVAARTGNAAGTTLAAVSTLVVAASVLVIVLARS